MEECPYCWMPLSECAKLPACLEAEIDRLRAEADTLGEAYGITLKVAGEQADQLLAREAEIVRLRLENERLREALARLVQSADDTAWSQNTGVMDDAIEAARAVLADNAP